MTDANLEILAEGPVYAIHQSDEHLNGMDDWNTEHHTQSGLVKRVKETTTTEAEAETETLNFIKQF